MVTTTLDLRLQQDAEAQVKQQVATAGQIHNFSNGALVSLDAKTGEILAMVGSVEADDTKNDGEFNVATAPRHRVVHQAHRVRDSLRRRHDPRDRSRSSITYSGTYDPTDYEAAGAGRCGCATRWPCR